MRVFNASVLLNALIRKCILKVANPYRSLFYDDAKPWHIVLLL